MEETRYIMQGGNLYGKPFEIIQKEEPNAEDCKLLSILCGADKIKVYKAKLEFLKEIEMDEDKKWI